LTIVTILKFALAKSYRYSTSIKFVLNKKLKERLVEDFTHICTKQESISWACCSFTSYTGQIVTRLKKKSMSLKYFVSLMRWLIYS